MSLRTAKEKKILKERLKNSAAKFKVYAEKKAAEEAKNKAEEANNNG